MAAKRLGSFLSNVTGTAGQVLRVNSGETGFEMFTPATIPAYTVTNKTVDRAINADDVTLDEVADVLATLIDDLATLNAPGSGTQTVWTSSTYNSHSSGTRYTLNHNFGSAPDLIVCQVYLNSTWCNILDYYHTAADDSGLIADDGSTDNTSIVRVFRMLMNNSSSGVYEVASNTPFRFVCFKLGVTAQITPFQWSTSEQVWPYEKDTDGSTLYCKQFNVGAMPNNGTLQIDLGFNAPLKIFRVEAWADFSTNAGRLEIAYAQTGSYTIGMQTVGQYLEIYTNFNASDYNATHARVIYKK